MSCDRQLSVQTAGNNMSNKYARTLMLGLHAIFQFCLYVFRALKQEVKTMFLLNTNIK